MAVLDWKQVDNINSGTFTDIAHSDSLWLAAGNGYLWRSTNGKNWESVGSTTATAVFYAGGMWFLYFAGSTHQFQYSRDGVTWLGTCEGLTQAFDICFANNIYVAASESGLLWSVDGITWEQSNITNRKLSIAHADGLFVACGVNGTYWSTDGQTWTQGTGMPDDTYIYRCNVSYAGGIWFCGVYVESASNIVAYRSEDGKVWSSIGFDGWQFSYGNNVWVAGAADTGLWQSNDSLAWEQITTVPATEIDRIIFAGGIFVACVHRNGFWQSSDGAHWAQCSGSAGERVDEVLEYLNYTYVGSVQDKGLWYAEYPLPIIDKFNVDGNTYDMEPVLDPVPTQDSVIGVESGGIWTALKQIKDSISKSNVPVVDSQAFFTAGGAWSDKATGAVAGSTKVFTEKELYKYLRYILDSLGYTSVQIPASL